MSIGTVMRHPNAKNNRKITNRSMPNLDDQSDLNIYNKDAKTRLDEYAKAYSIEQFNKDLGFIEPNVKKVKPKVSTWHKIDDQAILQTNNYVEKFRKRELLAQLMLKHYIPGSQKETRTYIEEEAPKKSISTKKNNRNTNISKLSVHDSVREVPLNSRRSDPGPKKTPANARQIPSLKTQDTDNDYFLLNAYSNADYQPDTIMRKNFKSGDYQPNNVIKKNDLPNTKAKNRKPAGIFNHEDIFNNKVHETPAPQMINNNLVTQSESNPAKSISNQPKSRMSHISNAYDDRLESENYFANQNGSTNAASINQASNGQQYVYVDDPNVQVYQMIPFEDIASVSAYPPEKIQPAQMQPVEENIQNVDNITGRATRLTIKEEGERAKSKVENKIDKLPVKKQEPKKELKVTTPDSDNNIKCNCKSLCTTEKCICKKMQVPCNSKCHVNLRCKNY